MWVMLEQKYDIGSFICRFLIMISLYDEFLWWWCDLLYWETQKVQYHAISWLKTTKLWGRLRISRGAGRCPGQELFFSFLPWQSGSLAKHGMVWRQIHVENEAGLPRARIWDNTLKRIKETSNHVSKDKNLNSIKHDARSLENIE